MALNYSPTTADGQKPREGFTRRDCLVCAGLVAGLGIWTRPLWPAGTVPQVLEVAEPIAIGGGSLAGAGVLMAMAVSAATGHGLQRRRYRRRWTRELVLAGLTEEKRGEVLVPTLASITASAREDVLRVKMLPSQSPKDWERRATRLATAFGAASGRIAWHPDQLDEVELVFGHTRAAKEAA
jgi:hypothetical protein